MSCYRGFWKAVCLVFFLFVPVQSVRSAPLQGYTRVLNAVEAGDDTAVLDSVLTLSEQAPELGPDLVALVVRLAPWLAAPVASVAVMRALPEQQTRLAAAVLAAALAASEGRHAADILAAVRTAAPHADVRVLQRIVARLGKMEAGSWGTVYALRDVPVDQPDDYKAMKHGMAALRRVMLVIRQATLDPLPDSIQNIPDPSRIMVRDHDLRLGGLMDGDSSPSRSYEGFELLYRLFLFPPPHVPSLLLPSPS